MIVEKRDWSEYNTKLVNRGKPSTYLFDVIKKNDKDLIEMNKGKLGSPYQYSFVLIFAAFAIKSVDKKGYREAEGTVEDYLSLIGINCHQNFRTIQWRISQLKKEGIKLMIYKSIEEEKENIDVIIDSTGARSRKDGDYRTKMYDKIKTWKQIHIAISRKTRKILNMKVTKDHAGDANQFVELMEPIVERKKVKSANTDGAYDSETNFECCYSNKIEAKIPVRINAIGKGSKYRKRAIEEQFGFKRRPHSHRIYWYPNKETRKKNQDKWKKETNFHQRSLVETVNSVFKGVFDESVFSKKKDTIEKELLLKAVIYNKFIAI